MYTVDSRDTVVELKNMPQSDVGAPLPFVWADDYRLILEYLVSEPDPNWDGTDINIVSPDTSDMLVAIIRFHRPYIHMFGPPNDEAFHGHPLASRGLTPYSAFEVLDSSWLRQLEKMNSVHPYHDPQRFMENRHHFVFAFHDSTFECIAESFSVSFHRGSLTSSVEHVLKFLAEDPV
ncbi:MAG: hypothetical protein IGS38_20065 [Synechococcales cyanobacterium M58_A2018_015]|nr:hypothetical protein [Synechococcales cyanobacterium M58_A2018_015]